MVPPGRAARCRHWLGLGKTWGASLAEMSWFVAMLQESSWCHSSESCGFVVRECLGFNVKTCQNPAKLGNRREGSHGSSAFVIRSQAPQCELALSKIYKTYQTFWFTFRRSLIVVDICQDPNRDLNVDAMRFDTWNRAGKLVCELLLHGDFLGCASQSVSVFLSYTLYM